MSSVFKILCPTTHLNFNLLEDLQTCLCLGWLTRRDSSKSELFRKGTGQGQSIYHERESYSEGLSFIYAFQLTSYNNPDIYSFILRSYEKQNNITLYNMSSYVSIS